MITSFACLSPERDRVKKTDEDDRKMSWPSGTQIKNGSSHVRNDRLEITVITFVPSARPIARMEI